MLFIWLNDVDTVQDYPLKAEILQQIAPYRQRVGRFVRNRLIVHTPFVGVTQEVDRAGIGRQDHVLYRVASFLAAITDALLIRVFGACNWAFRAVVIKRG